MQNFPAPTKRSPSVWHDLQRDWQRWNHWERRTAASLGLGTVAAAGWMLTGLTLVR